MKRVLALVAVTALLASACGIFHTTWLEVSVAGGYQTDVFEMEWPWESGEYVTVNQSLTDSAGFGSIRIELYLPSQPTIVLWPSSFRGRLNNVAEPLEVPDEGTATVFVTLRQAGRGIAQGHVSWPLHSGVDLWRIQLERLPLAWGMFAEDQHLRTPRCDDPICYEIRRIEIDEAARNYPDEALWVTVRRHESNWFRQGL